MKEESLLLLSDLQKIINQVVLIDYTIIILGGIYMLKKVKEILDKRSKINDEDDYRIEKCRDELIDALSQDELLTIDILNYGCL